MRPAFGLDKQQKSLRAAFLLAREYSGAGKEKSQGRVVEEVRAGIDKLPTSVHTRGMEGPSSPGQARRWGEQ